MESSHQDFLLLSDKVSEHDVFGPEENVVSEFFHEVSNCFDFLRVFFLLLIAVLVEPELLIDCKVLTEVLSERSVQRIMVLTVFDVVVLGNERQRFLYHDDCLFCLISLAWTEEIVA